MHFNPDGKGRVVINFDSLDEADWLMGHLKGRVGLLFLVAVAK